MNSGLVFRTLGVWFILVIAAILNGGFRNAVITPSFGAQTGHVISTIILTLIIFVIAYFFVSILKTVTQKDLWLIGIIWLLATLSFDFIFGHYAIGPSWSKLFSDYNFLKGRFFMLIIISTLIAPFIAGKFLNK